MTPGLTLVMTPVTDVETKLLTYAELAEALGINPASAKRLAIRRGWQKTPGNDGKARVAVPIERLMVERSDPRDNTGDDAGDRPSDDTPDSPGDVTGDREPPSFLAATAILTQHIERLSNELQEVRSTLEIERARGAQVDALTAILEIERKRAGELVEERNRWAGVAEASQKQLSEMLTMKAEAEAPVVELSGLRGVVRRWLKVG